MLRKTIRENLRKLDLSWDDEEFIIWSFGDLVYSFKAIGFPLNFYKLYEFHYSKKNTIVFQDKFVKDILEMNPLDEAIVLVQNSRGYWRIHKYYPQPFAEKLILKKFEDIKFFFRYFDVYLLNGEPVLCFSALNKEDSFYAISKEKIMGKISYAPTEHAYNLFLHYYPKNLE